MTDSYMRIMACAVLATGFGYLFLVTFYPLSPTGLEHSKTIVGFILGSVISIIIGYFWGSSSGSAAKEATIKDLVENSKPPVDLVDEQPPAIGGAVK